MTNIKAIKKAHSKVISKKQLLLKAWRDIRKDERIDRRNSILDLINSGIDKIEAIAIIDNEIRKDKDNFKFEAFHYIEMKKSTKLL
jgi:uncharacterized protein YoaH (UPF0181 family)